METKQPVEEQTTKQQDTAENDAVRLLLELLEQQKEPSQNFMEVLQYVAGMQMQLNVMVNELQSVREQLGKIQESQPEEKKHPLMEKLSYLQEKVTNLATHLSKIKDQLVDTAVQAVSAFKEKGREEMNKVLQKGLSGVKEALLGHRERLLDTLTSYEQTANQIDSIGDELKQIGTSAANVGRLLSGKGTKEISVEKPGVAVTRAINAPIKKHIAKLKKQMDRVDKAIEKIDGISSSLSAGKDAEKGTRAEQVAFLAAEIDQLSYDYDTHQYKDTVKDREAQVANITEDIQSDNVQYINDFLNALISEEVRESVTDILGQGTDISDSEAVQTARKARELLDKLAEYKPLAKVEELEEQNYNMIDNVLNNGAEKKEDEKSKTRVSVKEKLAEKKAVIEKRDKAEKNCPEKDTKKKAHRDI